MLKEIKAGLKSGAPNEVYRNHFTCVSQRMDRHNLHTPGSGIMIHFQQFSPKLECSKGQ